MKPLSIVIPIYNEEAILESEVESIVMQMRERLPQTGYELLLVENGSHDRTRQIAQDLEKKYSDIIRAFYLPEAGYGPALKHGLLASTGEFVVLFNIDFWDVPFIDKAIELQKQKQLDMVVGSKTMHGAEDTRPFLRRLITRSFNKLLKALFGFWGTDTHGIKLLLRDKMASVIQQCRTEREIFDTEFVLRAQAAGFKTDEIPVVCQEKRKTTYNIAKRIPRTAKDLVVLFFSLRKNAWRDALLVCSVFASVLFFFWSALYGFPDSPAPWFDNGINLGIAKTFVEDHVYTLRLAPGRYVENRPLMISTNYPALLPIIIAFQLFGVGIAQAQVVMIIFLCFFLLAIGLLLRQWYGWRYAAAGLALTVTFLPLYAHGMSGGLGEAPGLLYLFLALYFLQPWEEKITHPWRMFLSGLFFGLCGVSKIFYLVAIGAFGITELALAVMRKRLPWRRWVILAAGIVPPMLLWLRTLIPGGIRMEGIAQTLTYYKNPYATESAVLPNLLKFVTETTPMHFAFLTLVVFVFFIIQIRQKKLRQGEAILALFVLFTIASFVRTAGWYRYFFPAHIVVLALFPVSVYRLFSSHSKLKKMAIMVVGALVVFQAAYAIKNRGSWLYYNPVSREFARELETKLVPADASLLVVDKPELWFFLNRRDIGQYITMNPYVSFGDDIFAPGARLPRYIVSGEAEGNQYLAKHLERFSELYAKRYQHKFYVVYERK